MLLARSALERGADSAALAHVLAAPRGRDPESEGERLFLLASALDRLDARDSAAASYKRAAAVLPLVSDWMLLRAAAATGDSAARAAIFDRIVMASAAGADPAGPRPWPTSAPATWTARRGAIGRSALG